MSKRIAYNMSGNVAIQTQVTILERALLTAEREVILRELLHSVWADAYTHGWSDGHADRDPSDRANPYEARK